MSSISVSSRALAYNSGSVSVEVGTNAVNGASVTVRSTNGGLQNVSSPTTYINNLTTDEVADSYRFTGTSEWN